MASNCYFVCINLDRDVARKESQQKIFEKLKVDHEFISAQDGKDLNIFENPNDISQPYFIETSDGNWFVSDPSFRRVGLRTSAGEFGCSISHLYVYQKLQRMLASKDQTLAHKKYFVIMEDDNQLDDKDVMPFLATLELLPEPDCFDVCLLSKTIEWFPPIAHTYVNSTFFELQKRGFNRSNIYIVTAKALKTLVNFLTLAPVAIDLKACSGFTQFKLSERHLTATINHPSDDLLCQCHMNGILKTISCQDRYVDITSVPSSIWNCLKTEENCEQVVRLPIQKFIYKTNPLIAQHRELDKQN